VADFFKERNLYPVVLTCDAMLKDVCEAYGIDYFLLELPRRIAAGAATSRMVHKLLENLSNVFGFIKINNMILYGEYRGKHPGELKLVALGQELSPELVRDLKICKELATLNITF
jgi:hypothetical protein